MDDAILGVEQQHAQLLLRKCGHFYTKQIKYVGGRGDAWTLVGLCECQSPAKFQRGFDLGDLGHSQSVLVAEVGEIGP